jgi:hypothetical protein
VGFVMMQVFLVLALALHLCPGCVGPLFTGICFVNTLNNQARTLVLAPPSSSAPLAPHALHPRRSRFALIAPSQ